MPTSQIQRRDKLALAAITLLEESGTQGMSTRKIAAAAGTSTMSVYSDFGSLGGLVAEIVDRGFAQLADAINSEQPSGNAFTDLGNVFAAYREFALRHPNLYRVMFAVESVDGHIRSGEELRQGGDVFMLGYEVMQPVIKRGNFEAPGRSSIEMWGAAHGIVLLELAGYLDVLFGTQPTLLRTQLGKLLIGNGCDAAGVWEALEASRLP